MKRVPKLVGQIAAVGLVAGLFGLLVWKVTHEEKSVSRQIERGETPAAPQWTLDRIDRDGELSLASLRGKVVVLNFWASWCYPCRQEAPELQAAYERWRDRGVVFVGIDARDLDDDGRRFMRKYGVRYPNVRDGSGAVAKKYGAINLPETFFVARDGRIIGRYLGRIERDKLDQGIRLALAEQ